MFAQNDSWRWKITRTESWGIVRGTAELKLEDDLCKHLWQHTDSYGSSVIFPALLLVDQMTYRQENWPGISWKKVDRILHLWLLTARIYDLTKYTPTIKVITPISKVLLAHSQSYVTSLQKRKCLLLKSCTSVLKRSSLLTLWAGCVLVKHESLFQCEQNTQPQKKGQKKRPSAKLSCHPEPDDIGNGMRKRNGPYIFGRSGLFL